MTLRRELALWLIAFLLIFPVNGLVHAGPGAVLFDRAFAGVASALPMREGNPLFPALLDLILAGAMVLFLLRGGLGDRDGVLTGATLGLVASATWNLANLATVRGWPMEVALGDTAWHVALGAAAGFVLARAARRFAPAAT